MSKSNLQNRTQQTTPRTIHDAAKLNDVEGVREALRGGVDVDLRDQDHVCTEGACRQGGLQLKPFFFANLTLIEDLFLFIHLNQTCPFVLLDVCVVYLLLIYVCEYLLCTFSFLRLFSRKFIIIMMIKVCKLSNFKRMSQIHTSTSLINVVFLYQHFLFVLWRL